MGLSERYRAWQGTLDELAAEAERLAPTVGVADAPNARSIRHYQSVGTVERPERGPTPGYGGRHLLQALATKALLADGWKLAKIASFMPLMSDAELEDTLSRSPGAGATPTDPDQGARPAAAANTRVSAAHAGDTSSSDRDARASALVAVNALRGQGSARADTPSRYAYATRQAPTAATKPAAAKTARSASASRPSQATPYPGQSALSYAPATGVHLVVDASALARMSDAEIDTTLDGLAAALKRDRPGTPGSTG